MPENGSPTPEQLERENEQLRARIRQLEDMIREMLRLLNTGFCPSVNAVVAEGNVTGIEGSESADRDSAISMAKSAAMDAATKAAKAEAHNHPCAKGCHANYEYVPDPATLDDVVQFKNPLNPDVTMHRASASSHWKLWRECVSD